MYKFIYLVTYLLNFSPLPHSFSPHPPFAAVKSLEEHLRPTQPSIPLGLVMSTSFGWEG